MKGLEAKTGLWDLKREHLAVQCIKLFKVKVLVTELCLILQPRILEWVTIPSPRELSDPEIEPRSPTLQADSSPSELSGKP